LGKAGLKGDQGPAGAGATTLPVLSALGFEAGEGSRVAWQNFTNVCKESFDYLAKNLSEKADDPLEASKLASEAFGAALKKAKAERLSVSKRRVEKGFGESGQKKVVSRTVAIALAMVCILLVAALVAVIVVYKPMSNTSALESQLAEKDAKIASLNSSVTTLQSLVARYVQYFNENSSGTSDLDAQINALNAQIDELNNYLALNASGVMLNNEAVSQAANNYTSFQFDLQYAGYVSVNVQSSTSSTTYVEVLYSAFGINYDENKTVGTSGTAAFPVLPATIEIRVGNTESSGTITGTVTAIYYY
jgi:tRNA(His) 5'-end guanylyltransferase